MSVLRGVSTTLKHVLRALGYGLIGGLIVGLAVAVYSLDARPDLKVWHTADLDEEFTADTPIDSFDAYLALEDRLFAQLDGEVYDEIPTAERSEINRFTRGSRSDPSRWPRNWNRSFVLPVDAPRFGVLLIHGMSDSPYSMRSLAESLHAQGAFVVGMRVPGHGTAPSGLVRVEWRDMAAAVRLAAKHVKARVGDRPLMLVGYSNGGALSVEYALEALEDPKLPAPDRLVLLSPEIGITKFAALAVWQERLGHLLGLQKLAWTSILPEYDPFKYGSFALNAGKVAWEITREIQSRFDRIAPSGALAGFPPVLAFQSVVDATVTAPDLVTGLFDRLPEGRHELVLFDINRFGRVDSLLKRDPSFWLDDMLRHADQKFTIRVVSNVGPDRFDVVLQSREAGANDVREQPLGLAWPRDVYSLAHVALPFPPDDPVYGGPDAAASPGIHLGNVALRGERGVLVISADEMLRLRWNPFHSYVVARTAEVAAELAPPAP